MEMYIVFEGIDGSGKTTQAAMLCDAVRKLNYAPIRLQEPTYGKFGAAVRLRIAENQSIDRKVQHEQFTLDRREHVKKKIKPALAFVAQHQSFVVIQDRCYLSAPAYQARSSDEATAMLSEQQKIAPRPDHIFLLDLPAPEAMKRIAASGVAKDMYEKLSVLEDARDRYLAASDDPKENIHIVDATGDPVAICDKVLKILNLTPAV